MSKAQFLKENLREGEIYAGLLLGKGDEPDAHIFLLAGKAEKVNWDQAREWATKIGGDLPTRREQSLLFANLKEQFEPEYYWSNEQHADYSVFAWLQYFDYGSQVSSSKSYSGRARAVRRLVID